MQNIGERVSSRSFVFLLALREPVGSCPRLGLVVTRKVGNAVVRARVKRVCRECFRLWPGFIDGGVDLLVIARAGAHSLGLADVQREWEGARPAIARTVRKLIDRAER